MRISTSQIFSQSLSQINSSLSDVSTLNSMNSSQKKLNAPSDDPSGMGKVVELSGYDSTLADYADNCSVAGEYLDLADDALTTGGEQITSALEILEQGSTETYTAVQLEAMADELSSYLDSLLTIANTQMGSDAVFAGKNLDGAAYEYSIGTTLGDDLSNGNIQYVTGEIEEHSILVEFDTTGTVGTDPIDYRYSTDGGENWTTASLAAGDTTLDLGTAQVELTAGTAVTLTDDSTDGTDFIVRNALAYVGSDTAMSLDISESTNVDMTTVGSEIFGGIDPDTGEAYQDPNLFETICDAIAYLENGDSEGCAACLDELNDANELFQSQTANVGARENRITATEDSISVIRTITTNSISNIEDADSAQIIVELEQANYVYQAVLSSTADIMQMSLLNFI